MNDTAQLKERHLDQYDAPVLLKRIDAPSFKTISIDRVQHIVEVTHAN